MPSDARLRVAVDMDEISDISLDLIQLLDEEDIGVGQAALAFAISLGRVLSPRNLSVDEQIKFTQDCMDWAQCYFAEGSVN